MQPAQSPMHEDEEQLRHPHESEGKVQYYYPGDMPGTTYSSVTVVHEIPQTDIRPSGEQNPKVGPEESSLQPKAEGFQPVDNLHQEYHKDEISDSPGGVLKETDDLPSYTGEGKEDMRSPRVEENDVVQPIAERGCGDENEAVRKENHDEQSKGHEPEDPWVNYIQEEEETEVRRSTRCRSEPDRLT